MARSSIASVAAPPPPKTVQLAPRCRDEDYDDWRARQRMASPFGPGGTLVESDIKADPETDRWVHPYPEMPLNWWLPVDFNSIYDRRQIPK
eukprot:8020951-Lingulodinium_polyedra.AAC.1